MKVCPICNSSMNRINKYDYPSSSACWMPHGGGTAPLEGSIDYPSMSSGVHVIFWKCPNCGYCISEKVTDNSGSQ